MKSGIIIRILVALLILGGITTFLLVNRAKTHAAMQRQEAATLAIQKSNASRYLTAIQKHVTVILEGDKQALEAAIEATNAVFSVTGKKFERQPPKGSLSRVFSSPPPPATTAPPEKKTPPTPAPVASDDAPPGELSRELLDKLRQAEADRKGVPVKKPDAPEGTEKSAEPTAEQAKMPVRKPGPPPEPDIAVQARKVVGMWESIAEKAETARTSSDAAETLAAQASAALESRTATACANALLQHHNLLQSYAADVQEQVFAMGEPLQAVRAAKEKSDKDKELLRLAEEQMRKDESHRKLVQEELLTADGARSAARDRIKLYKYDEALESLKAKQGEFTSDEAKKIMATLVERYTRLQKLHDFLVTRINAKKCQWGWGQGPTAKDVLAATKEAVKITGQTLPWTDASLTQMLKLLKHYLADTEIDRKVRADYMMTMAVFYYEHGSDDEAQKIARELNDAYPTMRDDLKRLLPF